MFTNTDCCAAHCLLLGVRGQPPPWTGQDRAACELWESSLCYGRRAQHDAPPTSSTRKLKQMLPSLPPKPCELLLAVGPRDDPGSGRKDNIAGIASVWHSLASPVAHCDCILGRQVKAAALGHNLGVSYKLADCNLVEDFCHLFHLKSYNANTLEHMILFIFLLILCCAYSKISYNISEFNVMQK